jgi:glycosyltransferase involved in cell wall biosynthesis
MVGTFHNCDDTFVHTIRFPSRLRAFDAIILMSRTQEPFFLKAGVKPERIHVVPHGVDTDYFQPSASNPDGPFTVLAAGGYRRNFPLLREVCLRLKNQPDIQIEIVAPVAFRKLFADVPNARFRTGLSDAEFLEAYQTCSCLLQTVENATANNVILEAMACGQPVVAERIGGIPEYVDETCAILTAGGDADALAAAIVEMRDNPTHRAALAAGARRKAETFAWKQVAAQMRAIYETL